MNIDRPTLIMVRGLPGSGKSYLTAALAKTLGVDNVVILDPDSIDYTSPEYLAHSKALTAEGIDKKFHPYRFVRTKAWKGIDNHKILIWNQPFTSLNSFTRVIASLNDYAHDHNMSLPMLLVEVQADASTAHERVKDRKAQGGHGPSPDTFTKFTKDYASFADQGFRTVSVNGHDDVNRSVATVTAALNTL